MDPAGNTTLKQLPRSPDAPLIGLQVGNILLTEKLGQGGFGDIYLGEHQFVGLPYAVKLLQLHKQESAKATERFKREARALALLKHPNIVQFYDFGEVSGLGFYMVMEYLAGENLQRRLRYLTQRRSLYSLPGIRYLISHLCDVLAYIHDNRVVHRDIKPSNIFFHCTPAGEEVVKLLDFGIVSMEDEEQSITETGMSVGTANYLSPEQAKGRKDLDGRSDLYALGLLLYRLLTGKIPFRGKTAYDTVLRRLQQPAPTLRESAPWKPWSDALEQLFQDVLILEPERRIPDALTFKERFLEALHRQIQLELDWVQHHPSAKATDFSLHACTLEKMSKGQSDEQTFAQFLSIDAAPPLEQDEGDTKTYEGVGEETQESGHPLPWISSIPELDLPMEEATPGEAAAPAEALQNPSPPSRRPEKTVVDLSRQAAPQGRSMSWFLLWGGAVLLLAFLLSWGFMSMQNSPHPKPQLQSPSPPIQRPNGSR